MRKNKTQTLEFNKPNKQILYDIDHGKYYLKYDNDKKLYNSNIFGNKTPKMLTNTVLTTYKEKVLSHSMDRINFNFDKSLYRPQHNRFEGYTQFARPLVVPFTNVAQPQMRKYLNNTIGKFKTAYLTPKNKNIFCQKLNQGLEFYTGTINNMSNNKEKNLFLKKINESIKKVNNEKINNQMQSLEDSEIKALKTLRKKLMANSTNIIYGRKLKQPSKKFIRRFKINYNIYFRNPIEKLKLAKTEKKDYFKDLYKTLNKEEVKQHLDYLNYKTTNENKINNIKQPKIKKNIRYILSAHKPGNISQTKETRETFLFDDKDNSLEQSKCLLENNNVLAKDYLELLKSKKENLFSTLENNTSKNYKHLFSEDYEPNKMYFSVDNKSIIGDQKIDIRSFSIMNKNYKLEKKMLTGYVKPTLKEKLHFRKGTVKYEPFINLYKKELEMYKMVNPIRYKLFEEKEEKEMKYLKKRLEKSREISSANSPRNKI